MSAQIQSDLGVFLLPGIAGKDRIMTNKKAKGRLRQCVTVALGAALILGTLMPLMAPAAGVYADEEPPAAEPENTGLRASGTETYAVSYEYSTESLPESVMDTLPSDNTRYEDGVTVTAKEPVRTEVTIGNTVYTFDGWDENEKQISGSDIMFTGTWTSADNTEDTPDDTEYEDESGINNQPPPSTYADEGLVTVTGTRQIGNAGTHMTSFDHGYGTGICCYHNRKYAGVGSQGWMNELPGSAGHYDDIKRLFYWGVYGNNNNPSLRTAFSIHIMISYWRNGNGSLSPGIKKGTDRFKMAESDCSKLIKKGAAPANFRIYEWTGVGSASKKQIVITYKIVNGGYVMVRKQASSTNTDFLEVAPNNYSLAGAAYDLYRDEACTSRAYDTNYNYFTLITGASGDTSSVEVEEGSYWAKENSASRGYKLDSVRSTSVSTANTQSNPARISSVEVPAYRAFDFKFRKVDISGNHGYKELLGTEYTIRYYDIYTGYGSATVNAQTIQGKTPVRTWVYKTVKKTDSNGQPYAGFDTTSDAPLSGSSALFTEGSNKILPLGVFTIEETKAASGMARSTKIYYCRVYQASNGAGASLQLDSSLTSGGSGTQLVHNLTDDEQHPVIEIRKKDAETGEAEPQGADREHAAGSLAGAVYAVYYDDPAKSEAERVGTIVTDENGYGKLEKRTEGDERHIGDWLPLGRYYVEEETASPGYTVDALYYENKEDEYKNGRHIITGRAQEINTDSFTYTVESMEQPHHTYVSKKDITTGDELPGARLEVYDSQDNLVESWVSDTEPHDIVCLHDETQGLKDGKYTLREITAPYGYDVAEDVEFRVRSGKITNTVEMQNKPITIETTASDVQTDTHQGVFSENAQVKDKVVITGLYEGRVYKVKGRLIDKKTLEVFKDKDGNDSEAEIEFTATADRMEVELTFNVDSSQFAKETSGVAFERLERVSRVHETEIEVVPVEIAKHEDPDDEDQIIRYGGIVETVATDENLISHNILGEKDSVLVDTVEYRNLSTKENYTLLGEIFDKTTGQLTDIKLSVTFRPKTANGKTVMRFTFDATSFRNHDLVVYETLLIGDTVVDEHKDPNDDNQTVHVPEIATKAGKPERRKVKDVVWYSNLIPGQQYEMKGWLVDKDTGKKIRRSGGTIRFVPETSSGYVEVTLKTRGFSGKAVAFEECYVIGVIDKKVIKTKIAEHKDINDKDQTVKVPTAGPVTGDRSRLKLYALLFLLALSGLSSFAIREGIRSQRQRKEDMEMLV